VCWTHRCAGLFGGLLPVLPVASHRIGVVLLGKRGLGTTLPVPQEHTEARGALGTWGGQALDGPSAQSVALHLHTSREELR
jgi:hypothetical protein